MTRGQSIDLINPRLHGDGDKKRFRTLREPSVPPPPPPPPPQKPVRIERSVEPPEPVARISVPQTETYQERKSNVPKGVSDMAKEVMAELSGRLSRGPSAQREMTQSCHPDMAEWKDDRFFK